MFAKNSITGRPFVTGASGPLLAVFRWSMILLFLGNVLGNVAAGDEPYPWRIGVAVVKITPSEPVYMSGFGRVDPSTSVNSDLYAKALAFEDASGGRAVLMTADLVSIGGRMTARVCRRVMSATGLQRRQILLNVSHAHAGPKVWAEDVAGLDPAVVEATLRNISRMEKKLAGVMIEALSSMAPARLSWSWNKGFAGFVMSRRAYTSSGVRHGTNRQGERDACVSAASDCRSGLLDLGAGHGMLSGTPDTPGKAAVVVTATITREARKLDVGALSWGREKVIETRIETVGRATQEFVINFTK